MAYGFTASPQAPSRLPGVAGQRGDPGLGIGTNGQGPHRVGHHLGLAPTCRRAR